FEWPQRGRHRKSRDTNPRVSAEVNVCGAAIGQAERMHRMRVPQDARSEPVADPFPFKKKLIAGNHNTARQFGARIVDGRTCGHGERVGYLPCKYWIDGDVL